jgi:MoaA/NifB/PqqE/SkfB family radical SAM enzyme
MVDPDLRENDVRELVETARAEGRIGGYLWLYATYHCNLACTYCLTESAPGIANRRELSRDTLLRSAHEAKALGFTGLGITGGEVFMLPWFPETLLELSAILPTLTLTNATLFTDKLLRRLEPLASCDAALQVSLDSDVPARNDAVRGRKNYAKVVDAIPKLLDRGLRVRIATTVEYQTDEELERVCELHRRLGIPDDDHVVRPVVRRGRARTNELGIEMGVKDVLPELTLTADGAFLNPFAPTVVHARTEVDLLVSRQILPLEAPLRPFLRLAGEQPAGGDAVRNIR